MAADSTTTLDIKHILYASRILKYAQHEVTATVNYGEAVRRTTNWLRKTCERMDGSRYRGMRSHETQLEDPVDQSYSPLGKARKIDGIVYKKA